MQGRPFDEHALNEAYEYARMNYPNLSAEERLNLSIALFGFMLNFVRNIDHFDRTSQVISVVYRGITFSFLP